jgi:hypothetical protein
LAVALLLGLTQPLVHLWLLYCPPAGAEPSGLSIPDSALFLQSMRMFQESFASPYALCDSPWGGADFRYYAVPHLWLYGLLGLLADWAHLPHFLFLGVINGACLTIYLLAIWRFLRVAVPALAAPAFALFTLSSGPGGVLWLLTGALGLHDAAGFETWFFRFGVYDLMEGPHFHPLLIAPRCYYTLPLAVCYGALASMHGGEPGRGGRGSVWSGWAWAVPLFLATFIYARAGVFSVGVAALMAGVGMGGVPVGRRMAALAGYALPVGAGAVCSALLLRMNPASVQNHVDFTNVAMWISPAVVALVLHLPWAGRAMGLCWQGMNLMQRRAAGAALGYLVAYGVLYLGRGMYYGTLGAGQDGSVAAAVSDFALLGAPLGVWLAGRDRSTPICGGAVPGWVALWTLGFLAVSVSGFFGGGFLAAGPQRLQLFLWLPVCVLSAAGLQECRRGVRHTAWAVLLLAGAASGGVAVSQFQAGMGRTAGSGPYARMHAEWLPVESRALLERTRGGRMLALPPLSDAAALGVAAQTPFGVGSFNLSATPYREMEARAKLFFQPGTDAAAREAMVREWCVEWVAVWEHDLAQAIVSKELDSYNWLTREGGAGPVRLWKVREAVPGQIK